MDNSDFRESAYLTSMPGIDIFDKSGEEIINHGKGA